ncbi:MAG: twitching motility protein PilT [Lachnospiraceae bacterium]|nr:twitching motility protein PilT [Lachnospiraceae bacterium]
MIQIIAGEKGAGKTKRLLEMANESGKAANGHVVFIDDDSRHMYDLHYNIRFVKTNYKMEDHKTFFGFICGIMSQDSDIEHIYIDSLNNIVKNMPAEELGEFLKKVEDFSVNENVDFSMIVSANADVLPANAQKYIIN